MVAKIRLDCDPPRGGNAVDRALPSRTDTEGFLCVVRQRAVAAKLEIENIVEKAVGAEPGNLLRINLLDKDLSGRCWRQSRADKRETPGWDRVPDVLDRRRSEEHTSELQSPCN